MRSQLLLSCTSGIGCRHRLPLTAACARACSPHPRRTLRSGRVRRWRLRCSTAAPSTAAARSRVSSVVWGLDRRAACCLRACRACHRCSLFCHACSPRRPAPPRLFLPCPAAAPAGGRCLDATEHLLVKCRPLSQQWGPERFGLADPSVLHAIEVCVGGGACCWACCCRCWGAGLSWAALVSCTLPLTIGRSPPCRPLLPPRLATAGPARRRAVRQLHLRG